MTRDDGLDGGRSSRNEPPLSGEVAPKATEGFSLPLGEGGLRGLPEKVG